MTKTLDPILNLHDGLAKAAADVGWLVDPHHDGTYYLLRNLTKSFTFEECAAWCRWRGNTEIAFANDRQALITLSIPAQLHVV